MATAGEIYDHRAWEISKELNKQLLTLSTAVIAALFFSIVDGESNVGTAGKILALIAIVFLGVSILGSILGMQWDMKKHQLLAQLNRIESSSEQDKLAKDLKRYIKRIRGAGGVSRGFFLTAIIIGISLLIVAIVL